MFRLMFSSRKTKGFLLAMVLNLIFPLVANAATYIVKQGDSLYTISQRFGTTSTNIIKSNGLTSTTIYPGQALKVPDIVYTVKRGDSLFTIAKKFGVTVDALKKANNEWDNIIYPGQVITVPWVSPSQGTAKYSSTSKSEIAYTASALDLLARLIMSEAQSEPYNAKVGVAAVVVNRVKDSRFPNTISGVIYQKSDGFYQFTPVENGWINKPASEECKKAAYDALHWNDPSKGAMFYFDDSATNKWLWSKPLAARIGKMVFVY